MVEAQVAVALLFDDAELGGQLREALQEHGARIVHEGPLAGFDAPLHQRLDPDVLVVNLGDEDDVAFERLCALIDGDRPRLVFNDADASRALAGWDRARWARHLAVKVLASGEVDPPRPADVAAPASQPVVAEAPVAPPAVEPLPVETAESWSHDDSLAPLPTDSDDLEAELAALLAGAELPQDEELLTPSLPRQELPLHDGDFSLSFADEPAFASEPAFAPVDETVAAPADFDFILDEPVAASATAAGKPPAAPSWSLLDDDTPVAQDATRAPPSEFGIEKLSAADFLAPDVDDVAAEVVPTLSLELVSMEEAVAPQTWQPHEMMLDELGDVPSRVVLLGAAANGLEAACTFLAAQPAGSRLTFVLVQQFGERSAGDVLQRLSASTSLPLRMAPHGGRARRGEVLLVPAASQLQLRRDGSIDVQARDGAEPSIDASFSMAAGVFGRDALGIVFAGRSTDGVAGAQAIHDRGGQVWVESSSGEHFDDLVGAIFAEHLVSYSGTLQELAAHLIEVYP